MTRIRRILLGNFGMMLVGGALAVAPAAAQATGVITGVVVDSADGTPLSGALVQVPRQRLRAAADSGGRFVLRGVRRGTVEARVSRAGYEPADVQWELRTDSAAARVELTAAVIPLAEIRVQTDALDRLMQSAGSAAWTIGSSELDHSTASDALAAIEDRFALRPVACRAVEASRVTGRGCYLVRGTPTRVCVLMDETRAPGGLEELAAFTPAQIGRIYVFRGGSVVAVYSRWYLKQAARHHDRFRGIDYLTTSECRLNV
jgi:hypothetical protein